MAQQEYYVRTPETENARGPFTLEQLQSLIEAEQFDRESLYYDDSAQDWLKIGEQEDLCAQLFPEKKKLTLRKRGAPPSVPEHQESKPAKPKEKAGKLSLKNEPEAPAPAENTTGENGEKESSTEQDGAKPAQESKDEPTAAPEPEVAPTAQPDRSGIDIGDLLDAAEGNTEEMILLRNQRKWRERAASISLPMIALLLLLSTAVLVAPHWEELYALILGKGEAQWSDLIPHVALYVALADLLLGMIMALAATQFYPILRLRLMLGLGYFGYLGLAAWLSGDLWGLATMGGAIFFSAGLYTCTLTLNFALMLTSGIAALLGLCAFALPRVLPIITSLLGQ